MEEVEAEKAVLLNLLWHSRLPNITNPYGKHSLCCGAVFDNRFYAVAIWTDPIAMNLNGRNWIELRRMAIAPDSPKNTASRFIKICLLLLKKKYPHLCHAISYQDCDVHLGTIYSASGWKKETETGKSSTWTRNNRIRKESQTTSQKIRWGIDL